MTGKKNDPMLYTQNKRSQLWCFLFEILLLCKVNFWEMDTLLGAPFRKGVCSKRKGFVALRTRL